MGGGAGGIIGKGGATDIGETTGVGVLCRIDRRLGFCVLLTATARDFLFFAATPRWGFVLLDTRVRFLAATASLFFLKVDLAVFVFVGEAYLEAWRGDEGRFASTIDEKAKQRRKIKAMNFTPPLYMKTLDFLFSSTFLVILSTL